MTAFEAKTHFGELLERVARGEEIIITRHDKPVARIVPEGQRNLQEVRKAIAGIRELRAAIQASRGGRKPLSDEEIKSAIENGRR